MLQPDLFSALPDGSLLTAFGILLSVGAVGWWIRSGNDVRDAKASGKSAHKRLDKIDTDIDELKDSVSRLESEMVSVLKSLDNLDTIRQVQTQMKAELEQQSRNLAQISKSMDKLDQLKELSVAIDFMRQASTTYVQKDVFETRLENVEEDIRSLKQGM